MRVLAIDPGAKTGVCYYNTARPIEPVLDIIPGGLKGLQEWWKLMEGWATHEALVVESFEQEEGTHGIDLTPVEIIGWFKSLGIPIVWQRRMERGKNKLIRPAVLKRAGLYPKRGELREGHQVAALQHALAYLVKIRHQPTIALLHPKEA